MKTFLEFISIYEENAGATSGGENIGGTTTADIAIVPHGFYTSTKTSKTKTLGIFKQIHPLYTPYRKEKK